MECERHTFSFSINYTIVIALRKTYAKRSSRTSFELSFYLLNGMTATYMKISILCFSKSFEMMFYKEFMWMKVISSLSMPSLNSMLNVNRRSLLAINVFATSLHLSNMLSSLLFRITSLFLDSFLKNRILETNKISNLPKKQTQMAKQAQHWRKKTLTLTPNSSTLHSTFLICYWRSSFMHKC